MALLRDVIEAEEIRLDRWTVVFRPQSDDSEGNLIYFNLLKNLEKRPKINVYYFNFLGPDGRLGPSSAQASEENAQIFVMNNYFGIGKKKIN